MAEYNSDFPAGKEVELNEADLYSLPRSRKPEKTVTGTFYIWDKDIVNDRIKITTTANNVKAPQRFTGWANVSDLNKTIIADSGAKYAVGDIIYAETLNVFQTHSSTKLAAIKTGALYVALKTIINKRIAVTDSEDKLYDSDSVIGWVKLEDL